MRNKLKIEEKKVRLTITVNPELDKIISELHTNKSKYVEWLIYQDLRKNNTIKEDMML